MGIFASVEEIPVDLEGCLCENTPHDHDTVWLWAELTPDGGLAAQAVVNRGAPDTAVLEGLIGRIWLQHGISRWTFVDGKGNDIPPNPWNIAHLDWEVARPVAEKANDLYAEKFLRPLVARMSGSSRNGRTGRSTSAKPTSSRKRRTP